MSIWEMTLMGGVMVLVITALRAILLNKLPKRTFVFLWEIAMLRFVLPISIPAVTSVYSLFSLLSNSATTAQTVPKTTVTNIPMISNGVTQKDLQAAESHLQENVQAGVSIPICAIVWLAGMAITLAVFVSGYIIVYRRYRYATIVKGGYAEEWLSEQKIRRNVRILCSEQAVSPLTYGILHPTILLPESLENKQSEQLTYILMHEMTHIRRFDMLRKIAAATVLCIHWFNPAVWVLFLLYNRDIEFACDEAVVRKMKGDCRSAYAMALIGMEERRRGFSSLFSHFSKNAIEERIVAIMKFKKITALTIIAATCLIISTTTAFATSAHEPQSQQAEVIEKNEKIEYKSPAFSEITDIFGIYFKDDNKNTASNITDVQTASQIETDSIYGEPVAKADMPTNDLPEGNVVYFNTQEELNEHLCALEANIAKGLDRYAGFENIYADIDTSAPITYIIK